MKPRMLTVVLIAGIFLAGTNAFALMVSDAPGYNLAWHNTAEWQMLGESEHADDGVLWSTDGGSTWGNEAVSIGSLVTFQFEFWTAGYGNHTYDQLRAWADTDHSHSFDIDEELLYVQQWKPDNAINNDSNVSQAQLDEWNNDYALTTLHEAVLLVTPDMADGFWLRSRVHCNHTTFPNISATGRLSQGEVEDWYVAVNSDPVPEPATMLLLGTGLLGIAGYGRKKKKG